MSNTLNSDYQLGKIKDSVSTNDAVLNILLVDDEQQILSALKRVMRNQNFKIFTANNGSEAIEIISTLTIHIVVTDIKMPKMDGHALLDYLALNFPRIYRIVLTGYAELDSIKQAVNNGNINNYLNKPWDNCELLATLSKAKKYVIDSHSKRNLVSKVTKHHKILAVQNQKLKAYVAVKNKLLQQVKNNQSTDLNEAASPFLNLMLVSPVIDEKLSLNINKLAVKIAQDLGFEQSDVEIIDIASKLCEIGLTGLENAVLKKPIQQFKYNHYRMYKSQVEYAEKLLETTKELKSVLLAIKYQFVPHNQESNLKYKHLRNAQIIAIARDVWLFECGRMTGNQENENMVKQYLKKHKGAKYLPAAVELVVEYDDLFSEQAQSNGVLVSQLCPGMTLKRNLYSANFNFLFPKNYVLTQKAIDQLKKIESNSGDVVNLQIEA